MINQRKAYDMLQILLNIIEIFYYWTKQLHESHRYKSQKLKKTDKKSEQYSIIKL